MIVLNGALDSMDINEKKDDSEADRLRFPADYREVHKAILLGDTFQVTVKIKSSEAGGMYNQDGKCRHLS